MVLELGFLLVFKKYSPPKFLTLNFYTSRLCSAALKERRLCLKNIQILTSGAGLKEHQVSCSSSKNHWSWHSVSFVTCSCHLFMHILPVNKKYIQKSQNKYIQKPTLQLPYIPFSPLCHVRATTTKNFTFQS